MSLYRRIIILVAALAVLGGAYVFLKDRIRTSAVSYTHLSLSSSREREDGLSPSEERRAASFFLQSSQNLPVTMDLPHRSQIRRANSPSPCISASCSLPSVSYTHL